MSLGCIANDIVRIETSYASGDRRHLVQEYQYVVKDAKERYLVFDIINSEIFDIIHCEINVVKYAKGPLFSVSFSWQNMVEKLIMKENDIHKEWALIIKKELNDCDNDVDADENIDYEDDGCDHE